MPHHAQIHLDKVSQGALPVVVGRADYVPDWVAGERAGLQVAEWGFG